MVGKGRKSPISKKKTTDARKIGKRFSASTYHLFRGKWLLGDLSLFRQGPGSWGKVIMVVQSTGLKIPLPYTLMVKNGHLVSFPHNKHSHNGSLLPWVTMWSRLLWGKDTKCPFSIPSCALPILRFLSELELQYLLF